MHTGLSTLFFVNHREHFRIYFKFDNTCSSIQEISHANHPTNPLFHPPSRSRYEKMPILTPAYPSMNSSFNVTDATLAVMIRQFKIGNQRLSNLLAQPIASQSAWDSLFEPSNFLVRFPFFLSVEARSDTVHKLNKWSGFVESRVRKLVEKLEQEPLYEIFPYPKKFEVRKEGTTELEFDPLATSWLVGIRPDHIKIR